MSALSLAVRASGAALLLLGTFFCFAMTVGILRFPDALSRLHAPTKGLTIGVGLILLGAALFSGSGAFAARAVLIAAFMLLTNPMAAHAIARASYRSEVSHPPLELDEYGMYLERERAGRNDLD